jgi:hypothetical protein
MGLSVVLGFAAYGLAFSTMWLRLASESDMGKRLFSIIAGVWALYGIAFVFPVATGRRYSFQDQLAEGEPSCSQYNIGLLLLRKQNFTQNRGFKVRRGSPLSPKS